MAVIKEDGTNVANANSYEDVTGMKAYFTLRGVTFSGPDATLETKLIQATDYIDLTYYSRFQGSMQFDDQELQFPRDVWPDTIPDALRYATSELALAALPADLFFTPEVDASGKRIVSKVEKVGPIEEHTKFSEGGGLDFNKYRFPKAERWLSFLLIISQGGTIR